MINTRIYGGEGDEKDFESQKFVCIYVHFVWLRGGFGGALTCPYKRAIDEFGRERYRVGGSCIHLSRKNRQCIQHLKLNWIGMATTPFSLT